MHVKKLWKSHNCEINLYFVSFTLMTNFSKTNTCNLISITTNYYNILILTNLIKKKSHSFTNKTIFANIQRRFFDTGAYLGLVLVYDTRLFRALALHVLNCEISAQSIK